MQTWRIRGQEELFVAGSLFGLIPQHHPLRRIDAILDLSWLHEDVMECYCQDNDGSGIGLKRGLVLLLPTNRLAGGPGSERQQCEKAVLSLVFCA